MEESGKEEALEWRGKVWITDEDNWEKSGEWLISGQETEENIKGEYEGGTSYG